MKKWIKRTGRKTLCLLICLAMLATVVLADDWYLEEGDIHISADGTDQIVSQNRTEGVYSKSDLNPVIQGSNAGPVVCEAPAAPEANVENQAPVAPEDKPAQEDFKGAITVETKNGATANMTLSGVKIQEDNRSAIEVGDANVNITVNGDSEIAQTEDYSDKAAIHVTGGSVTITGTEADDAEIPQKNSLTEDVASELKDSKDHLQVTTRVGSEGAAIGSNAGEGFSGKITVEGNVWVGAEAGDGAAIGSGARADVTENAEITLKDDAKVVANSNKGAGIGSGTDAEEAQANVSAAEESYIPSNDNNHTMSGTITVTGNSIAIVESEYGAGIGSGALTGMKGSIHVGQNGKVMVIENPHGAGIGSGVSGDVTGTITVDGSGAVFTPLSLGNLRRIQGEPSADPMGAWIGSGAYGFMNGSIRLAGNSRFQLDSYTEAARPVGIGGGSVGMFSAMPESCMGEIFIGSGVSLNADGTPISIGSYQAGLKEEIQDEFELNKYPSHIKEWFDANPLLNSITIERGAHISDVEIQDHKNADPYLHCLVDTERGDAEECFHYHVYIVDASKPSQPTAAAAETAAARLYWVTKDGKLANFAEERNGDVLTVISQDPAAEFHSTVFGLNVLLQRGIRTVVFKTQNIESSFDLQQVTEGQSGSAAVVLSHAEGKTCLTVGNKDLTDLLK